MELSRVGSVIGAGAGTYVGNAVSAEGEQRKQLRLEAELDLVSGYNVVKPTGEREYQ